MIDSVLNHSASGTSATFSTLADSWFDTFFKWFTTDFWMNAWLRGPAATKEARETDGIAMFLWWFCVIWFVGLMGVMLYFVIKYRRRPGHIAPRSPSHNTPLEVAWTVIPTIFLVYMFFVGFWGFMKKIVAPGHAVEVRLVGTKWFWQLSYPGGEETNESATIAAKEIPIFYVPAGVPIKVRMNSSDVSHGFYIPSFRVKADVLPNRYTTSWFEALAPGPNAETLKLATDKDKDKQRYGSPHPEMVGTPYEDHWLFCSEYCGDDHSEMAALVRVVPEDAYRKWLQLKKEGVAPVDLGKQLWKIRCSSCHTTDGSKNTGPSWKDIYYDPAHPLQGGKTVKVDEDYIRESIRTPAAKLVEGFQNQMTAFPDLTEKQIDGIIAFMKTLSKHTPPEAAPDASKPDATKSDTAAPDSAKPDSKSEPKSEPKPEPKSSK